MHSNESKFSSENSNDIVELKSIQTKFKVKFLMFDPKNYRRPPYYGTWRKRSKVIRAKNPFAKDDVIFFLLLLKNTLLLELFIYLFIRFI